MKEKDHDKFWELVAAKLHNEISDTESLLLDELLEDAGNRELYKQAITLKNNVGQTKSLAAVSQNNSWKLVSSQLKGKSTQLLWTITKYAAIIVFAFLLGSVLTNQFNKQSEITQFAEVKVPLGQMSEITLFDGTKVWLNSGTTLRYNTDFGKNERKVSLDGEALFEVTKTGMPFKVKLKDTEVEVLGTTFNVVSYNNDDFSQVTLVEGQVNINNLSGSTIAELKPSDQIFIDCNSGKASITKVKTNFYTSWIDGKIVFDDEKLSTIAIKLERWYNVDIQFGEASLGELHFSGTILKHKPFNQIVTAFSLLLPVDIEYTHINNEKDIIVISQK